MLLPIRTSIRPRHTPYVNYGLIVLNVFFFLLSYWPHHDPVTGNVETLRLWAGQFMLQPGRPFIWQFVTYAFLHSGLMHILGNMYFLYLFGNNVNDRLGNVGYLCLYLGGAVFAGIGHAAFHVNPVLGASGAVAAVTGAYLVLFPRTIITVMYWFYFIGTTEISALYFIAFKLIFWDNVLEPNFSRDAIAYGAHLAGYAFGIAAILFLLATRLIERDQSDLWAMIRQWNRRRIYRDVVNSGYNPFTGVGGRKAVKIKEVKKTSAQQNHNEELIQKRGEIASLINQQNLPGAADMYIELVKMDPAQVMSSQYQLDISNQLMSMGRWSESADAYEKFLAHYGTYQYAEQVHLMLGILYSRYLDQGEKAKKSLKTAMGKLADPGQKKMCADELAKLEK